MSFDVDDFFANWTTVAQFVEGQPHHTNKLCRREQGVSVFAHVLQGLTELDPEDHRDVHDGLGAHDTTTKEAMLRLLRQADDTALPFVTMFYGSPSEFVWPNDEGTVH